MEVNEQLIEQITQMVLEELNKLQQPPVKSIFTEKGSVVKGTDIKEVGVGVGPTFGSYMTKTINGLEHIAVIKEVLAGIEEEGMIPKIIRVTKTSDVAFIGKEAALQSGSGIGIGIQSKGTAIIHQKDLYPLTNLELFPQAPLLSLETYRQIGRNAARYAKGMQVQPITVQNDYMVRPKYQVKAALMHIKETEKVIRNSKSMELEFR